MQEHRTLALRYYIWADDRACKLTHALHSKLLDGEASLPQFAGTLQRIIEAIVREPGIQPSDVLIRGSSYLFDNTGTLDLSEVADAIPAVLRPSTKDNVVDMQNVFGNRRWTNRYRWTPPPEAREQVLNDIIRLRRPKGYVSLPMLKP